MIETQGIHRTAIVDDSAVIGEDVSIGAYSVIGPNVQIGARTRIAPHVVVTGPTRIGEDNEIYQFASIGERPQDKKYHGEDSTLEIGDRNMIRESVTINRGTADGGGVTRVGNDNWIMAYCHIAHDCLVANNTIFSNSASLAGHVEVDDYAILGGFSLVHQFTRIGAHCFSGFGSVISKDVPPYVNVSGNPAAPHGLNAEGLKRRGFSVEQLSAIKKAYKLLYKSGLRLEEAVGQISELAGDDASVKVFADFLTADSKRSIIR